MFGNGNGAQQNSSEMTIYMGQNMEFTGTLTFEGTGRIDGKVQGKIIAKGVIVIGEGATVSSELEGDTVIVGGNVEGKIMGRQKVQLLKTAIVNADITTPSFLIEEGCQFNGSCRMSNGAEAVALPPDSDREAMRFTATAAR
jgi:cytoskeletal protein CcmA (bactofilin family)